MGWVLGISAYYHDSAAALVDGNGRIIAAAQEERFSRIRHDAAFPANAIAYCLSTADIELRQIDQIVFYDKPLLKFERLLETYLACSPRGLRSFLHAMPIWLKEKLYLKVMLRKALSQLSGLALSDLPPLRFTEHHQSHAAAAFFPSPFERAAVLCVDGVGEWATTSAWLGDGNELRPLWEQQFPHSLGLLYSAFTQYLGFRVNSGEYKVMGLAPYGQPHFADLIKDKLVRVEEDGSFRLDMRYFAFATELTMTAPRFHALFGQPPRQPEAMIEQFHKDVACSIQKVTEDIMLRLARKLREETGETRLCLAGGVALNSVANGRLLNAGIFDEIWLQPAAGDAGSAIGAALCGLYLSQGRERVITAGDSMQGALLGPTCDTRSAIEQLEPLGARYQELEESELLRQIARHLDEGAIVGWVHGRMEFGPRALGHRSILADPRPPGMQRQLNLKIKRRESFRPFAPIVTEERAADFFELDRPSAYMQFVVPVKAEYKTALPAITHVDGSARVQTVSAAQHPRLHALLKAFEQTSGLPILVNTSFNRRGEPIVCTPHQAYACFMDTDIDFLVIDNLLLDKRDQPTPQGHNPWQQTFAPD